MEFMFSGKKKTEIECTNEVTDCISMSVGTLQKPVNETSVTKKKKKIVKFILVINLLNHYMPSK